MTDKIKRSAMDLFNRAKDTVSELTDKAKEEIEKSGAIEEIEKRAGEVKSFLDEKGVTEKAEEGLGFLRESADTASEHLDKLSGKKILELVQSRLEKQSEFNDILATKLEEALERISELEKKLGEKGQ